MKTTVLKISIILILAFSKLIANSQESYFSFNAKLDHIIKQQKNIIIREGTLQLFYNKKLLVNYEKEESNPELITKIENYEQRISTYKLVLDTISDEQEKIRLQNWLNENIPILDSLKNEYKKYNSRSKIKKPIQQTLSKIITNYKVHLDSSKFNVAFIETDFLIKCYYQNGSLFIADTIELPENLNDLQIVPIDSTNNNIYYATDSGIYSLYEKDSLVVDLQNVQAFYFDPDKENCKGGAVLKSNELFGIDTSGRKDRVVFPSPNPLTINIKEFFAKLEKFWKYVNDNSILGGIVVLLISLFVNWLFRKRKDIKSKIIFDFLKLKKIPMNERKIIWRAINISLVAGLAVYLFIAALQSQFAVFNIEIMVPFIVLILLFIPLFFNSPKSKKETELRTNPYHEEKEPSQEKDSEKSKEKNKEEIAKEEKSTNDIESKPEYNTSSEKSDDNQNKPIIIDFKDYPTTILPKYFKDYDWEFGCNKNVADRKPPDLITDEDGEYDTVLKINTKPDCFFDYSFGGNEPDKNKKNIECIITNDGKSTFYFIIEVISKTGKKPPNKYLKVKKGTNSPKRHLNGKNEWEVYIEPESNNRNWKTYKVNLNEFTKQTFGKDGWKFHKLIGIRVRGSMSIAQIKIY
ncbi:MAG: hypothetical protein ACOCWG_05530 [bacterium]